MNEKFSLSRWFLLSSTLCSFICQEDFAKFGAQWHCSLRLIRQRCFYQAHQELSWEKRSGQWGTTRPTDGHFYRLGHEEESDEPAADRHSGHRPSVGESDIT